MRKAIGFLLTALVLLLSVGVAAAQSDVAVTGEAVVATPYHQLKALYIAYPEKIVSPTNDDYMVMDFGTFNLQEDYERRSCEAGVITAVYTNCEPAMLADKVSVPGRYVIIEMATTDGAYFDETEQLWKPRQIAGLASWRVDEDGSEHDRRDWSLLTVVQRRDVLNAAGDVVAKRGVLPAMDADAVKTPEADCFTQFSIPSENGLHSVNFNIALPENYDESQKYPVVFCQPGGGGNLNYEQLDAQGNFECMGCDVARDEVPLSFVRQQEDLIVVAVQPWKKQPAEWEVDNVADYIYIIEYVLQNYSVDTNRIYAIASSQGTTYSSQAIARRPDLFTAYVQCNGSFTCQDAEGKNIRFTLYKDDVMVSYVGYTRDQIMGISLNTDNYLEQETIDLYGKAFDGVVEQKIPIYFFDGVNTQSGSSLNTTAAYLYLKSRYESMDCSLEQIDDLIQLHVGNDEEFHELGVCEYHASSKIAVTEGYDVIAWLLSRTK